MRILLLLFLCSILTHSETREINVLNIFEETPIFNDGVTYNIVTYEYASQNVTEYAKDSGTIKVGITSTDNVLLDLIWEYQSISDVDSTNLIQSIDLMDLNHDQLKDIVINYTDLDSDFPDQVISSFLINHNNKFQEISETFVKTRYEMLDNAHLKYETPLTMFGRPYIEDESQKNSNYWVDYYEFQGLKLVNINQKYRAFFETYRQDSSQKMNDLLHRIKVYKMTDEITINQLQLEEYFNQITELKTIIYRANKVLY
tara:strand:+ start:1750 stop:2523 length:774 start_codon:yes stop_codon:yes gene_type:complete